jgi:tetratricopeptide (TPR) repeat protein
VSEREPEQPQQSAEVNEALSKVAEIKAALMEGRAPRGRRPLQQAARVLQAAGRIAEATLALRTLALLELERGSAQRALAPAQAALRLARKNNLDPETDEALDLVARVCSHTGAHDRARQHAEERLQRARSARNPAAAVAALRRLALVHWKTGAAAGALDLAGEAVEEARSSGQSGLAAQAGCLLGTFLLRSGCPTAANGLFSSILSLDQEKEHTVRILIARAWSLMASGRFDAAARDLRRAQREARGLVDRRPEVEAMAALAVAEHRRGQREQDAARLERARKLIDRAVRRSRNYSPRLRETVRTLQSLIHEASPDGSELAPDFPDTIKKAAGALVQLAEQTNSPVVVDACIREVRRLGSLAKNEVPYHISGFPCTA